MLNWIDTRSDAELAAAARDLFTAAFPDAPEPAGVWAAPGRVNLIGEHIDYAGGASIPFALEQNTAVAVAPRTDGLLRIASEFDGSVAVAAYELCHGKAPDDAARAQLAQACIRAENEVVGVSTGGLDQNASLLGQRGKALFLDFSTGAVERVPFNIEAQDMVLLIADTNAPHTLSDGQYASRRGIIDAVQAAAGRSIREIPDAVAFAATVNPQEAELYRRRVRHVVEETERTLAAATALTSSDPAEFRRLMRESHISLRDLYEVTTPELDSAFTAAGEIGARMTGGGFGGAVIALIPRSDVESTAQAIYDAAASRSFPEPTFLVARPGDGARRLA